VTLRFTRWRAPGRAIPLALAFSLIALPVVASENTVTPKPGTEQVSLRQAAARAASRAAMAAPRTTNARHAAQSSGSGRESTSWFKTKPGVIALAVMVIGSGYAVYSVSHDRITSPAKK
jgi:hypothetical protein